MIMLAKGNRSQQVPTRVINTAASTSVASAVRRRTGAAEHQGSGMRRLSGAGYEAIWKIEVEDFPAFILVDDKATTSSSKSSTNSARTALSNLSAQRLAACCQVIPLGHLFCVVISRLLVNSQYFP